MTIYQFRVEWDQRQYRQEGMEMEYAGTARAEAEVNVIARNEAEAREAIVATKIVYEHQKPTIELKATLPVHLLVSHKYERGAGVKGQLKP